MKSLFFYFFFDSVVQFTFRCTVNDQTDCFRMHIAFIDQLCNSANCLNSSSGAVTDKDCRLHGRKNASADMFHTSLIVYHNIRIMILIFCKLCLKKSINIAIAAFSLCSAHNEQIKIIFFCQSIFETHLCIIRFGHSFRNRTFFDNFCLCDFFSYIAECGLNLNPEDFIKIRVCICIHCKDWSFALFTEILNQHSA